MKKIKENYKKASLRMIESNPQKGMDILADHNKV